MFTKRHSQELSEIKALTQELGQRFQQVLEQLERIQEAQDQLAAQSQPARRTGDADSVEVQELAAGTKAGKRRTKSRKRLPPAEPAVISGSDEG